MASRGPDGARRLGRRRLALAPHAHAAGLHRGERGQPRHARPRAAARGARRAATRSASLRVHDQAAAARVDRPRGPTSTRRASACGAGAAAARSRCTSCSARPTCTRWACRSRRCPTCGTTTRSTRSGTWACRAPTRRRTTTRRRSTSLKGLKGDLLVVHGSGDDNVHYQGTEQLINALVAAGKPFTMMGYPNRHARDLRGTGHDARICYNLLTRYLNEHLAPRLESPPVGCGGSRKERVKAAERGCTPLPFCHRTDGIQRYLGYCCERRLPRS